MSVVESWLEPAAAVAKPLPAARPRRRPASQAVARRSKKPAQSRPGFRVRGSLVWMVVFALLLIGVVAVNVAVLRAHVSVNDLDTRISRLELANAKLESQVSSANAWPQVKTAAVDAGLIQAPDGSTTLIDMADGK